MRSVQTFAALLVVAVAAGSAGYYLGFSSYRTTVPDAIMQRPILGIEVDLIAYVYHIVDGDTFDGFPCGRVRLADINTPERNESGYADAKKALTELILEKKVYLDVDDLNEMDQYNRLVAVVYVEFNSTHLLNVNKWLLTERFAEIYDRSNEFNPYEWILYVKTPPS